MNNVTSASNSYATVADHDEWTNKYTMFWALHASGRNKTPVTGVALN